MAISDWIQPLKRSISKDKPPKCVECKECGRVVIVDLTDCRLNGWPECCGETMLIDGRINPNYDKKYSISEDGCAITCKECGMTSYHPKDVEHKYCGNCHKFLDHGYRET